MDPAARENVASDATDHTETATAAHDEQASVEAEMPAEAGGPAGLEPTRYGDWERKGRCIDF